MSASSLDFIFKPRSVAVVGASETPSRFSSNYVQHLMNYGFKGPIYPVNPNRKTIFGLKAYPNMTAIPEQVDYVINCISLENTPALLDECAARGVTAMHVFSGRGSETQHEEALALEQAILQKARARNIRLMGPNCMGIYCPKSGLSMGWDLPREPGRVSAVMQSGGNSIDLVRWSGLRGLRFSKVVSYGNAIDLNESDFLEYLAGDPETDIILLNIEGVKNGRRFLDVLSRAARRKPVIVLKIGRTAAGRAAAVSHTASLAGSSHVWMNVLKQAGAITASNFDEWMDFALAFSLAPRPAGDRLVLAGGAGGQGVMGADECEEMGFKLPTIPQSVRELIREDSAVVWDWVGNPVDMSIMRDSGTNNIEVLRHIINHPDFDFVIARVSENVPTGREDFSERVRAECAGFVSLFKEGQKPVVVVLGERSLGIAEMDDWRWQLLAQARTDFVAAGVPFFPSIARAAKAMRVLIDYHRSNKP